MRPLKFIQGMMIKLLILLASRVRLGLTTEWSGDGTHARIVSIFKTIYEANLSASSGAGEVTANGRRKLNEISGEPIRKQIQFGEETGWSFQIVVALVSITL